MDKQEMMAAIECMLFVAGEPVPILELQRVLDIAETEIRTLLWDMQKGMQEPVRGILLSITEESVQLCSNRNYANYVEDLLQPAQQKTFSQTLLETLAIVAYRQPVTRAEVETIRGVRCEYAVAQLQKMHMIQPIGRKDTVGRPVLYGITDAFLRHFGIQSVTELPNYEAFSSVESPIEATLTV